MSKQPEFSFAKNTVAQMGAGLMDQELEDVERALRRRRRKLGFRRETYTRAQNTRLIWLAYSFGMIVGVAAGLIIGFGYAGGFQ